MVAGLKAQLAGDLSGVTLRNQLSYVAGPPGEVVIPGLEGVRRAVDLLKDDKDINFEGSAGAIDFDENGDVVTPIEIWQYSGGTIETVRLESL